VFEDPGVPAIDCESEAVFYFWLDLPAGFFLLENGVDPPPDADVKKT